jgi:predicted nuclease with TOPRIM domain
MENSEEKIEELERKFNDLENKLTKNEENTQRRHEEMKALREKHYESDKRFKEISGLGTFTTPIMIAFAPFIEKFLGKNLNKEKNLAQQTDDDQQIIDTQTKNES